MSGDGRSRRVALQSSVGGGCVAGRGIHDTAVGIGNIFQLDVDADTITISLGSSIFRYFGGMTAVGLPTTASR
jgi:hypothetical protein